MLSPITLDHIRQAALALKDVILPTPTLLSAFLSERIEGQVFLKMENLQLMGSFKLRGACIKFSQLSESQKRNGVITMSAGNHAQGVAYQARAMGITATVVMPENTPLSKIERTQALGATVVLEGKDLSESGIYASHLVEKLGLTLIPPYDDPAIITGQGTVALEMLAAVPDLEVLIIPVGGGGLAAGMAIAARALNPEIEIIGVQAASCPAMAQVLYPDRAFPVQNFSSPPLAEGIAVKAPGLLTREILKDHLSDIFIVTEDQIEDAIEDLLIQAKVTVEGAGAAGVAALMANPDYFTGRKVGTVLCGGNIDVRILSSILLRGLVHDGKLARLKIDMNDAPGLLGQILQIIGHAGGNVFELSHQRLFNHINVKMTEVDVVVETRGHMHTQEIVAALHAAGFPTEVMA